MLIYVDAVVPAAILIGLGWGLNRWLIGADFWRQAERLTYFVLMPALLIRTLSRTPSESLLQYNMGAAIITLLVVATLALVALKSMLKWPSPSFTSIMQGVLRQNTFIGLALAFALLGEQGLALASVALIAIVPLVNIICVIALVHGQDRADATTRPLKTVLRALAANPLIIGILLGLALIWIDLPLPGFVDGSLEILGRAALPLGLLAVGAGLTLRFQSDALVLLAGAVLARQCLMPLAMALLCWAFAVEGEARFIAVLFFAIPTAVNSYILARQLGGDADLMARIITFQTLVSVITIPLALALLA